MGSGGILFLGSYIAFIANVIQFGMGQFQTQGIPKVYTKKALCCLSIGMYGPQIWKFYVEIDWGTFIYRVLDYHYGLFLIFSFLIIIIVIGASVCFAYNNGARMPSIPNFASSTNSYGKIYQVIKYSLKHNQQHTNNYASRLDVGKEEHGGPLIAKQVKDVKVYSAFY